MNIFSDIKDKALSVALKAFLTAVIGKYVHSHDLTIDSDRRSIYIMLFLKGESTKLEIEIGGYDFIQENGKTYFTFNSISASRDWLDSMAQDHFLRRRFEVPEKYVSVITKVL
ncbi:MAG: hypothetical protein HQM09_04820 [Candidatus Riflebacteria bacterium]|nr:hypothetical protein [Candidatus Riflebacteria bacterium]